MPGGVGKATFASAGRQRTEEQKSSAMNRRRQREVDNVVVEAGSAGTSRTRPAEHLS